MIPKQEVWRGLDAHPGAIAIMPRLGCVYLNVAFHLKLRCPAQSFAQDLWLVAKLGCVVDVLILAAATATKIGAAGLDALSGRIDDVIQLRPRKSGTRLRDYGVNPLAGNYKRKENGLAGTFIVRRQAGQSIAPVNEFFDF
jgi:hypothetical protein